MSKGVELVRVERDGDKRIEYWRQEDGRVLRHISVELDPGSLGAVLTPLGKRSA